MIFLESQNMLVIKHLEVFNEAFQERDEVLGFSDISWYCFIKKIIR